jgi:uncharacterized protein (TIRG00374 family)
VALLGAGVSLAAIYLIVSQMRDNDFNLIGEALRSARMPYVGLSAAIVVAGLLARGARWRILLSGALPFWRAFSINNVAYLINGLLPFRVGEVARAFLATRAQAPVPILKSFSTIIVERLLDVLAVLVIMLLALSAGPLPETLRAAALVLAPVSIVAFLALVFLSSQREGTLWIVERLSARIPLVARWRIVTLLGHFLDGLSPLTSGRALAQALAWTTLSWVCSVFSGYVLMLAFFDRADMGATLLFTAVASLAVAVPAVPGNLGTYELSILLALQAMGYGEPAATAGAFAVAVHAVNLIINATMGVIGFMQEGVSLGQLSEGVRAVQRNSFGQRETG